MKKTISFLLAALLLPAAMFAQTIDSYDIFVPEGAGDDLIEAVKPQEDKMIFNHLALGASIFNPSITIVSGIATTVSPYAQLRLQWDWMPSFIKYSTFTKGQPFEESFNYNGVDYNLKMDGKLNYGSVDLLADIYPGKKTGFRFTVGLMVDLHGGRVLDFYTTEPLVKTGEGTLGLVFADKGRFAVEPGQNTTISLKTNAVVPYLGIGFGRAVRPDKRVRVVFDMGMCYYGGLRPVVKVQPFDGPGSFDTSRLVNAEITSADLDSLGEDFKNIDYIPEEGVNKTAKTVAGAFGFKIPGRALDGLKSAWATNWVPYLNLSIYVRIF